MIGPGVALVLIGVVLGAVVLVMPGAQPIAAVIGGLCLGGGLALCISEAAS